MAMGLTPTRRSYSSLTVLGEDATFSRNVKTGVFGNAERSSSQILMSPSGRRDLGSSSPLLFLFRCVYVCMYVPKGSQMPKKMLGSLAAASSSTSSAFTKLARLPSCPSAPWLGLEAALAAELPPLGPWRFFPGMALGGAGLSMAPSWVGGALPKLQGRVAMSYVLSGSAFC